MDCEEIRVDLGAASAEHSAQRQRSAQLLYRLNHTLPFSEEYNALLRELLGGNLGEGSTIAPPLSGAALDMLKIGRGGLCQLQSAGHGPGRHHHRRPCPHCGERPAHLQQPRSL